MRRVTVTAFGNFPIQTFLGLEAQNPGTLNTVNFTTGDVKTFDWTESQWSQMRPVLEKQSQKRIIQLDPVSGFATSRTKPLMTYVVERFPGDRPRLHQVEAPVGGLSVGGAAQTTTLRGENLIAGISAFAIFKKGTPSQLTVFAARKGPGERVSIEILAPSGGGSVAVAIAADGGITVTVTPAAAGPGAIAIAAQINGSAPAALWVSAAGAGAGTVGVIPRTTLTNGAGAGIAYSNFPTAVATAFLEIEAQKPGNQGNTISLVFAAPAGAGSVVVVGNKITVTPAAAGPDLTAIAAQINADAVASLLVLATARGAGATVLTTPVAETFLVAGAGETPTIKIGGAVATILTHDDTSIAASVTGAALTAAGVAIGDIAIVTLLTDYQMLTGQMTAVA